MRIELDQIPDPGLEVTADLGAPWARDAVAFALGDQPDTLDVKLTVKRLANGLVVKGTSKASALRACDRCAQDIRLTLSGDLDLFYTQPAGHEGVNEGSLKADELGVGWLDGEGLELGDVLSEQFTLLLPDRVRCVDEGVEPIQTGQTCSLPVMEGESFSTSPFAKLEISN